MIQSLREAYYRDAADQAGRHMDHCDDALWRMSEHSDVPIEEEIRNLVGRGF